MARWRIIGKLFVFLISIACAALFFVPIENRILWGYWVLRPTLKNELNNIDKLLGVSFFEIRKNNIVPLPQKWKKRIESAERKCMRPIIELEADQCLEERLIVELDPKWKLGDPPPEVDNILLSRLWNQTLREGWMPKVVNPKYIESRLPYMGLSFHFLKSSDENLLIAYHTGEISDDRHVYAELLYKIYGSEANLFRRIHLFYEIAGLEGLTWQVLWVTNSGILLIFSIIYWFFKKIYKLIFCHRIPPWPRD